jgi:hypothetical protein
MIEVFAFCVDDDIVISCTKGEVVTFSQYVIMERENGLGLSSQVLLSKMTNEMTSSPFTNIVMVYQEMVCQEMFVEKLQKKEKEQVTI